MRRSVCVLLAGLSAGGLMVAHCGAQAVPAAVKAQGLRDTSVEEYRQHLAALETLTEGCAKGRDTAGCDPKKVGADDRVAIGGTANSDKRIVQYEWLRVLLAQAQSPDGTQKKDGAATVTVSVGDAGFPAPKTTTELLQEAQKRLAADAAQAAAAAGTEPAHAAESQAMREVLARREFRRLQQVDPGKSVYEKLMGWLNRFFNGVGTALSGVAWVGRLLVWGFLAAVGVGLVWALLQLERRWRVRLVPDADGPAAGAASARDWQLWMEDARKAAAQGLWREAIHFVYWAAISRLESKRLWPADRARTPREYLALVAPEDARKAGLAALTGSFERVWYGGRAADEADYRRADELAASLISGGEAR